MLFDAFPFGLDGAGTDPFFDTIMAFLDLRATSACFLLFCWNIAQLLSVEKWMSVEFCWPK